MSFVWTDAAVSRLRQLWTEGVKASAIGHELGCSKSAVLGKRDRLGLEERKSGWAVVNQQARAEGRTVGRRPGKRNKTMRYMDNSQAAKLKRKTATPPIRVIAREGRLVEPLNLPFGELDDHQKPTMCRYPTIVQEGRQLFCARPAEHGTSYCDDCCRVVYTADGYERQINKAPRLRHPAIGQVLIAAPFSNRDYNVVGLVREVSFS
jgi:hypothetical protein